MRITAILAGTASAFTLPGLVPRTYKTGDHVPIYFGSSLTTLGS